MCLAKEFDLAGIPYQKEEPIPVDYKGIRLDCGYQADFIVDGQVIIEAKAVSHIKAVFEAQLLTYLKVAGIKIGLLMNFNEARLIDGLTRFVV